MSSDPNLIDLVRELREALGMPSGALPISPEEAWKQSLNRVEDLAKVRRKRQTIPTPKEAIGILRSFAIATEQGFCVNRHESEQLWDEFRAAIRALGWEVDDEQK